MPKFDFTSPSKFQDSVVESLYARAKQAIEEYDLNEAKSHFKVKDYAKLMQKYADKNNLDVTIAIVGGAFGGKSIEVIGNKSSLKKLKDFVDLTASTDMYSSLTDRLTVGSNLSEAKAYLKKGKMFVLKKPVEIDRAMDILAIGRDTNGNKIVRLELAGGKKKTVQLDGAVTISIDDVVDGLSDKQIENIKSSLNEEYNLNEGKEEAAAIRKLLKDELGLSSRDVGVKSEYGGYSSSVKVTIKTHKALLKTKEIEAISEPHNNYQWDERTQEILAGGNTFVFVAIDYKLSSDLEDKIHKEYVKATKNGFSVGDSVVLYNTVQVDYIEPEHYRVMLVAKTKVSHAVWADVYSEKGIPSAAFDVIGRGEDYSLYAKIK